MTKQKPAPTGVPTEPPAAPPPDPKQVVGWREYVSIPEWSVPPVKAKVDTGARTSALDVANITELDGDRVRFEIVTSRKDDEKRIVVETDVVRRTRVKSSFGASHDRLIVRARVKIGPIERDVEMSLVCRKKMLCRMLLGRKALEPDLLVDATRRYLHGRKRRVKRGAARARSAPQE